MAAALMTQWLFNFVIAKITPLMISNITYGTFLLFGACCILMGVYTVFFVPETKNVPLESIHLLFEDNIVKGCLQDIIPRHSRAMKLQNHHVTNEGDSDIDGNVGHKGTVTAVQHIEEA
jgi:MFS transporter, SP family, sugar:H+ symporter